MIKTVWSLIRDTLTAWIDDYAPSMGAALAFYTLFSIAPLLLIVISVAGLLFGEDAARGEIMEQLSGLVGVDSARTLQSVLESLNQPSASAYGTVVGVGVLLIGATTVFGELQNAMDRIWRSPDLPAPRGGFWSILRSRLLSAGVVLGVGFLLMVSLVASAALAALGKWWAPWFGNMAMAANLVDWALSFLSMTALFGMIYKWLPRAKVPWSDVLVGAALTALLFTIGKFLIGLYIGRSGVASPFGAAASLVVLLLWVYYSAQIFLLGAEFTWIYSHRHGSRKPQVQAQPQAQD
ncbi:YihY/virulence factor BrkB family protein [Hydrogenophaga palleronii]|uniref:YihY/virulence factor BrkB family protein n=1 Tax=Hydrogenophaga palleronii TaxID=65655 RepID=UPI000824CB1D|nr:YihY/virulence factor BrkB family protein [Hydrogenophaga palleronii]